MTDPMAIRAGSSDDAAACASIIDDWIEEMPWLPRKRSRDEIFARYRDVVLPKRDVFVIGQPVLAYISLNDAGFVTALYAKRPGHGLGKTLLDYAKTLRSELRLWTFVANARARSFYHREGFQEIERSAGDNDEGLPDVQLRWRSS